jgi:hypothetical protein
MAEGSSTGWEVQLYGGEYYEDQRIGNNNIVSKTFLDKYSLVAEFLYERYDNYNFTGIGGHLLLDVTDFARIGLVGSHSHEEYTFDADFEDRESEDVSDTLGLEAEINYAPVTFALQTGRIFNNSYNNDRYYLSSDIFFWGAEYIWYARGAVRKSKNYKEYTIEGYRTFFTGFLPVTLYAGTMINDLGTKEELRTYHTSYDSVYTGGYIEFLTTSSSSWNLWVEAAKQDEDTIFSVELNILFGPGANAPYISAFGFTP